jgi:hypothetical protein
MFRVLAHHDTHRGSVVPHGKAYETYEEALGAAKIALLKEKVIKVEIVTGYADVTRKLEIEITKV